MKTLSQYLYEGGIELPTPVNATPKDTMGMGNPMPPTVADGKPGKPGSEPLVNKKKKCKKCEKKCDK